MKKIIPLLGFLVMLGASLYFLRALAPHLQQLSEIVTNRATATAFGMALLLYLAIHGTMGLAWWRLLRAVGLEVAWHRCLAIFSISQMAKYLPGNFFQHIGRVTLARQQGWPTTETVIASLWELVGVVLTGGLIAAVALGFAPAAYWQAVIGGSPLRPLLLGVVAVAVLLAGSVLLVRWLAAKSAGRTLRQLGTALAVCCGGYALVFLLHGLSLQWLIQSRQSAGGLLWVVGIYTLAWLAGFLTPGAGGGVGVRETVMLLGLTPICGEETAAVAAVAMRAVSTLGDGIAFALGLLLSRIPLQRSESDQQ